MLKYVKAKVLVYYIKKKLSIKMHNIAVSEGSVGPYCDSNINR